jgi:hypothetical protein
VSPFFGSALWTMDYVLGAAAANIKRAYFHHGTIGACYYCFWGRDTMSSPYYGAYAATAAMAGGSSIATLDDASTNYGGYVIFDAAGRPLRALLYNSDYFSGTGTRGSEIFVLEGLGSREVRAKRLTAESAEARADQGSNPSFGGQTFENATCVMQGRETFETVGAPGGRATFAVAASEALLVYLQ